MGKPLPNQEGEMCGDPLIREGRCVGNSITLGRENLEERLSLPSNPLLLPLEKGENLEVNSPL